MNKVMKVLSKIWLFVILALAGTLTVSAQAAEVEPYQGIFYNGSEFVSIALYTAHNPNDAYYKEGIAYLVNQPYWGDYGTLQMDIIQSLGDIVLMDGQHVFWDNADLNTVEFYPGTIYINGSRLSGEFVQVSNSGANMYPGDIWFQMPSGSSDSSSSNSSNNAGAVLEQDEAYRLLNSYINNVYLGNSDHKYTELGNTGIEGDYYWTDYLSYTGATGTMYINMYSGEVYETWTSPVDGTRSDWQFLVNLLEYKKNSGGSSANASSGNGSGKVSNSDIVKATTSSYLSEPEWGLYHTADCIIDGDVTLAWTEDVPGQGIGEWVQFDFSGSKEVSGFDIWAGHHYSKDLYEKNSRPKTIRVYTEKGYKDFNLQDSFKSQRIDFGKPVKTSYVKIEVKSVYEGWKYDDTCISEISFY